MEEKIYDVPSEWSHRAYLDEAGYRAKYEASIRNPDAFWAEEAKRIHWFKAPTRIKNTNFGPGNVSIRWFEDGVTNVAYNCIDRHLHTRGDQVAIIWEGDDPAESKTITYRELARRGLPHGQHHAQPRRREGRPGHDLHADDPGSGLCHARLRAARRDPLGGVRRLLAGFAREPHPGRQVRLHHHRRRGPARRPEGAAEGERGRRHRARRRGRRRSRAGRAPHRLSRQHGAGPRRLLRRGRRARVRRMPRTRR